MNKKDIQRKRIMNYFIESAKEIIKKEGAGGLTARKVGEHAGYSYATIYNYFRDLNELLAYCVFDLLEDCYRYMINFKDESIDCKEQILIYSEAYMRYFSDNPDMFQLIFIENLGSIPVEMLKRDEIPSVSSLLSQNIKECANRGYIPMERVEMLENLIGSSIHGKLLFYLNKRNSNSLDDILKLMKEEIKFLIGGEVKYENDK
jgi:AcrR family transcriptional regulator